MTRRLIILFIAFVFAMRLIAAPALAAGGQTGNIQGTVVDSETHAPIADVRVTASSPSATYTARTDSHGFFSMLGVNVDTYTVSFQAEGYSSESIPGVVAFGDQTQRLGLIAMTKTLRTIAKVTSRAPGAYQPNQTIDSYTVGGTRISQAVGKTFTTNETQLLTTIPGVTLTNAGEPTIRGAQRIEVGYQYDGVPFTEPFGSANASAGLMNGISDVQVVEGAGDATQGNIGAGVINVIPKRGTYPAFGTVDFEAGAPAYRHQAGFELGWATPNQRFSDYITFVANRHEPYYGYTFTDRNAFGNYFSPYYEANNLFTNNFIFRFGKSNNQSFQVLYTNVLSNDYTTVGSPGAFDPVTNPNANVYYPYDPFTQAFWMFASAPIAGGLTPDQYASLIALTPGVPATNQHPPGAQISSSVTTRFLKFEYDNNLNASTYLALRYYNLESLMYNDSSFSIPWDSGGTTIWEAVGGPTTGMSMDVTHQFGSRLTATFNVKYDVLHPIWDGPEPQLTPLGFLLGDTQGGAYSGCNATGSTCPTGEDWLPGGYVFNFFCPNTTWTSGPAPSCLPRFPDWAINYHKAFFQNIGAGLRFQYQPSAKWNLDLGFREEGQNQHWFNQLEQFGQGPPKGVNPFDVFPSSFGPDVLNPRVPQPRGSIVYRMGLNDSLRFGYGRSAVFAMAQTAGTPFSMYGIEPFLKVPAQPGSICGYPQTPGLATWPCRSYAEQLYWEGDAVEFPDVGETHPALYTNYDFSYQHLFRNGMAIKLTPFYKQGSNLPANVIIMSIPGGGFIFGTANKGKNFTTGGEVDFTTPQRPFGFSGFLSMTYQNVLSTTPPFTPSETFVPALTSATLALGNLYRAGYVSPFVLNVGGTYTMHNGLSITPDVHFDIGYPYTEGNLIAAQLANGKFANVPMMDFGPAASGPPVTYSYEFLYGSSIVTQYYDPSFSGSLSNPNIAWTRGVNQTASNGGFLSHPNVLLNLNLQYKSGKNVIGLQIANLFGNAYVGTVPMVNPMYQPVATGLSGPQTNFNPCASPYAGWANVHGCVPQVPNYINAFTNGAYLLSNGDFTAAPQLGPLTPTNFLLYFQRQL